VITAVARMGLAGGLCAASLVATISAANASSDPDESSLRRGQEASRRTEAPPTGVSGSKVTLRNETNLYGNTPKTFEVRTTHDGSKSGRETSRGTLAPGQSVVFYGDNTGIDNLDVRMRIYVDGQLKAVLGATNRFVGFPYVDALSGDDGNGRATQMVRAGLSEREAKTVTTNELLKVWAYRGSDSGNRVDFVTSVWTIPTKNAVDNTPEGDPIPC
jgi:hypothetical protein